MLPSTSTLESLHSMHQSRPFTVGQEVRGFGVITKEIHHEMCKFDKEITKRKKEDRQARKHKPKVWSDPWDTLKA